MKMLQKVAAAALVAALSVAAVTAEEGAKSSGLGKYVKLTLGYATGGADTEWDFDGYKISEIILYKGFEVVPTFGLELPISALEEKNLSLGVEGSVGLTFGSNDDGAWKSTTTVVAPTVMGVLNYHIAAVPKLVPFAGVGFSVPIQIVSVEYEYTAKTLENDSTVVGFKINTKLGARYDITDNFSALGEFDMGIIGVFSWAIRAGAMYRF